MEKMRNLLLTVLLGTVVSGNVFAQAEEGDSIPAKYREQQEKYERGEGLYPAKMRNSWKIGGFIGQSAIYGDVAPVTIFNGAPTLSGGADVEKAIGHLMSIRVLGSLNHARGLNSKLNTGYAGHDGKAGYYPNPFASSVPGGSYYNAQTGVAKAVAYNYASTMANVAAQAVFHVGNLNYYKEQNKWDLYLGVGPGLMGYQTLVDAKKRVGSKYELYDFAGTVKGVTASNGKFMDDLRYNREVRKALQTMLKSDDATGRKYNYESDVEADAPIQLKSKKSGHVINIRPMAIGSLGLRYKVNRRIELGVEQQFIYAATDLFDGVRWQERQGNPRGVLSHSQDLWGNTVVNLGFRLGKNSTDALWWVNPNNPQAQSVADNKKLMKGIADDTDGDGVADLFDKDPSTPNNVTVDGGGKVLDTDQDGVADALDEQPFTTKGCIVDAKGIAKDSDSDGVPDCRDKESGTKSGVLVDANGRAIVMPEMPVIPTFDCSKCAPVPQQQQQTGNTGGVIQTIRECNLPSAHFDNGSSVIKQEFYPDLFYVAKYMLDHGGVSVRVIGQDDKSEAVARKRAESAINFIVGNFGIDRSRFTIATSGGITVGSGNSNKNPKSGPLDYLNRRVDFECQ